MSSTGIKLSLICLALAIPIAAQSTGGLPGDVVIIGWPLENARILQAIGQSPAAARFDLTGAQITSPPDFTTRTRHPQLELMRIERQPGAGLLLASLRCRTRAECRSFLVEIALRGTLPSPQGSMRTDEGAAKHELPVLVSPRERARLVMEEDGVRIIEPVRAVQSGRMGDIVRVVDPATHRSIAAEVVGRAIVRPLAEATRAKEAR